jgi:hypothetical protein
MRRFLIGGLAAALFVSAAPFVAAQGGGVARVPFPTRLEEGVTLQAVGRVTAVTPGQAEFTLSTGRVTLRVRADRRLRDNPNVRVGDRVRVQGDMVDNGLVEAEAIYIVDRGRPGGGGPGQGNSDFVNGQIRRFDRDSTEFVLDSSDDRNVRVSFNESTVFVRDGNVARPRDFRVGDTVRVIGRRIDRNEFRARRVVANARAGWVNNAIGEIISINGRTRTLEVDFDGEVWTVQARTAGIFRNNRRLEIDDLRVGQDIRVQGRGAGGRQVGAERIEVVRDQDRD